MSATAPEPQLREVRGPSAVGGGWRRGRDLLYLMSVIEFKRIYFDTALGYLWTLMRPLILYAVLLTVFTKIFGLGNIPNYPEILLMNIVLFSFFQEATMNAVGSIVAREGIVRKTQFPRLVIPLSVVMTSVFNLGLNLVVVLAFVVIVGGVGPMLSWLAFPLVLVLLFILTSAVAMLVSALFPRFRDTGIIWGVFVASLFYATPVVYTPGGAFHIPETLQHLIYTLNPLASILELARMALIEPGAPSPAELAGGAVYLLIPAAIVVCTCVLGAFVFNREAPRIAEVL